jgi:hypothetical protein
MPNRGANGRGGEVGRWRQGGKKRRGYSALSLLQFEAANKARLVNSLETLLLEFERKVLDLTHDIAAEEELTGVKNPASIGYSTFARATALRRATMLKSIEVVKIRLKDARRRHGDAVAELTRHLP